MFRRTLYQITWWPFDNICSTSKSISTLFKTTRPLCICRSCANCLLVIMAPWRQPSQLSRGYITLSRVLDLSFLNIKCWGIENKKFNLKLSLVFLFNHKNIYFFQGKTFAHFLKWGQIGGPVPSCPCWPLLFMHVIIISFHIFTLEIDFRDLLWVSRGGGGVSSISRYISPWSWCWSWCCYWCCSWGFTPMLLLQLILKGSHCWQFKTPNLERMSLGV